MNEDFYQLYKVAKRFVERVNQYCEKHSIADEEFIRDWKKGVENLDAAGRGYAERYEKEKNNECAV